jgi:hypothetical protein
MIPDLFRKQNEFYNMQGYDDIKDIVRRALDAEVNYNLLFIGPPASAKTLFLLGILDVRKNGVYFDELKEQIEELRYLYQDLIQRNTVVRNLTVDGHNVEIVGHSQ